MMRRDDLLHDVQRRRTVALIGATSALAALPRFARAQAQPIKVGVVLPLSGANMPFGVNSRNGIELVADQINASGRIKALGRTQIDLVAADATSTPTVAADAAERLIVQDGCVALIGAFASALTIAVSEVTERHGIPLLTMSFSDLITGRGFKNVFQVVSKGSAIGKAQFDYAIQIAAAAGEKIERAAIMYEDTAYGTSQAAGLRGAAKAANVQLVMDDAYSLGITDVAPMIDKLRNSSAQVVFPVSYLGDSLLIIRTMRQRSIDLPVIGGAAGYVIPEFVKGLGEFSDNVFSISPVNHDLAPEFTDGFRKRYGYFMVHEAIEHAVCMEVLVQAMEVARSAKPLDIRNALAATQFTERWAKAMTGGAVKFDPSGLNVNATPVMVQWQRGELATVWPRDLAKAKPVWRGRAV